MPQGKPTDAPCVQLDDALRCRLCGQPGCSAVCSNPRPLGEMCDPVDDGGTYALAYLARLETLTAPVS